MRIFQSYLQAADRAVKYQYCETEKNNDNKRIFTGIMKGNSK